jgi:hypothetical protein
MGLPITIHAVIVSHERTGDIPWWLFSKNALARNTDIAEDSDILLVTWDGKSRGAKDTINKMYDLNKPVVLL